MMILWPTLAYDIFHQLIQGYYVWNYFAVSKILNMNLFVDLKIEYSAYSTIKFVQNIKNLINIYI